MKREPIPNKNHDKMHCLYFITDGKRIPVGEDLYKPLFYKREKLRKESEYKNGILIINLK